MYRETIDRVSVNLPVNLNRNCNGGSGFGTHTQFTIR